MAFLGVYLYVTECFKKYILLLISIQDAPQKCKFQPAVNSAYMQRIQATCLISQHSESDFVKLRCAREIGPFKIREREVGPFKMRVHEIDVFQHCLAKIEMPLVGTLAFPIPLTSSLD